MNDWTATRAVATAAAALMMTLGTTACSGDGNAETSPTTAPTESTSTPSSGAASSGTDDKQARLTAFQTKDGLYVRPNDDKGDLYFEILLVQAGSIYGVAEGGFQCLPERGPDEKWVARVGQSGLVTTLAAKDLALGGSLLRMPMTIGDAFDITDEDQFYVSVASPDGLSGNVTVQFNEDGTPFDSQLMGSPEAEELLTTTASACGPLPQG